MKMTSEQEEEIRLAREARHETRRPTVPALEEMLYTPIPVLDHGFVRVIDYMGDDAAIVQAARVSYGKGTRKVTEDRGLIRYLMRHRHSTPFEMCEIKLHCKLPIFVARQWIRHRTACLTGDTVLSFDLPGAEKRGRRQHYSMTIERLHRLWHEGTRGETAKKRKDTHTDMVDPAGRYSVPELSKLVARREETLREMIHDGRLRAERENGRYRVLGAEWHEFAHRPRVIRAPIRDRLRAMHLRMCDEQTGAIEHTRVVDIWQTGIRAVFRVTLENGYAVKMTRDHRCLTERGWLTLGEATDLRLRPDGGLAWNGNCPAFAVNGVPVHQSRSWLAARRAEGLDVQAIAAQAGVSYHTIRKYLRVHGLEFSAKERSVLSGRAQRGQRRTLRRRRPLSAEALASIRMARSGVASNFWKGGITKERANIGRWTREHAARIHESNGWRCVICHERGSRLHAHHVDPVWHNPERTRDATNLTTLCDRCHKDIHRFEIELVFLAAVSSGCKLDHFWEQQHRVRRERHPEKRRPRSTRLARAFSRIEKIEYAGEEMTYDLAVSGPFHNFVANGFIVHNSVNEYSARYSILDREFYVPPADALGAQATANRQGRGEVLSPEQAAEVLEILRGDALRSYDHYQAMLNVDDEGREIVPGRPGLARELARMNLTLAYYTQWYWKIDLHNLLHFLSLRIDDHAQEEIRAYGRAIADLTRRWVPHAWEAFVDYRLEATHVSRAERKALCEMLAGEKPDLVALGLSKREIEEFRRKFGTD
ncbi:MAG: FAD-dependent thymidylate synthase [Deltaproteobacteria bacterium]|nr:FAD-dependent thymidylate synthase [Deltaproteobacteria bacterium]